MGIHQLNRTIKREYKECTKSMPISELTNESVAIDLSIMIHQCHSVEYGKLADSYGLKLLEEDIDEQKVLKCTLKNLLSRISSYFISNNIRPIIVTEGEAPALKKQCTHPKRARARKRTENNLNKLIEKLKRLKKNGEKISPKHYNKLVSLKIQSRPLSKEFIQRIINALKDKGYPVIQASGEAEELCTKLCLDGYVKAVFSKDTDNIVRRCPLLITEIKWTGGFGSRMVAQTMRYHPLIHQRLGLNYEQFVDYCIMMGCDYNTRTKGMLEWDIINLLFCYGSIENIEKQIKISYRSLNYKECRELFKERSVAECCADADDLDLYF